ncbi:MAG TPA: bifunctional nicotinamidase/pyrazinamidase [Methylocella sp.]|nr:bifunctional nicotinamidase/pyrazinamidase [Methylocella sp.]
MTKPMKILEGDILLVVDLQNDFCPGGRLAVPHGDAIVEPVNCLAREFAHVVLTQDWHPPGHSSFASAHEGRKPFETFEARFGIETLWPDHCVQGTEGAKLHPDLRIPHAELILRKGFHIDIDSYSAFLENDRRTPTGLGGYLRERGFDRLFLVGLALDYCVRYSAEDALRQGFSAVIIEDACRAMGDQDSIDTLRRHLVESGIFLSQTSAIL